MREQDVRDQDEDQPEGGRAVEPAAVLTAAESRRLAGAGRLFVCTGAFTAITYIAAFMLETAPSATLKAADPPERCGPGPSSGLPAGAVHPLPVRSRLCGGVLRVLVRRAHIHRMAFFTMIFSPFGGILVRARGARLPLVIGTAAFLIASVLYSEWHATWQAQVGIGALWGLGRGFFCAACPNLIMDAVPARLQGVSARMLAVFGAVGGSTATAVLTPTFAAHPFEMVSVDPGGVRTVTDIPQVFTGAGYSQVYLVVGSVATALALLLALVLRSGRTPARGGEPA
ncbi:hypothetical protein AB0G32_38455 [Streptomyces sp. NPDC023723]|uniref:hypothetical protein n=1 Tax=Streptomyces sp. NPDC023723 TaxID=3154323 RepID=UPI0033EFFC89